MLKNISFEEWNEKIGNWYNKIVEGKFKTKDVQSLILDIISNSEYRDVDREDNNWKKLDKTFPKIFLNFAEFFKCEDYQVSQAPCQQNLKIVLNNAHFKYKNQEYDIIPDLEVILGNAEYNYSICTTPKVRLIGGNANFNNYKETSLWDKLEIIGGDADFSISALHDTANLRIIGGNANFSCSWIESFKNIEYIGGDLIIGFSHIKDFGKLKKIYGKVIIEDEYFQNPELREKFEREFSYNEKEKCYERKPQFLKQNDKNSREF